MSHATRTVLLVVVVLASAFAEAANGGSQGERPHLVQTGHRLPISSVAFSPDGRSLASASADGVRLWDVATGDRLRTLEGSAPAAISPDGRVVASGGPDRTIRLWDAATGKLLRTMKAEVALGQHLAFSPDGKRLASGSFGSSTREIWDPATGNRLGVLKVDGAGFSIAFSPDGRWLAVPVSVSRSTSTGLMPQLDHNIILWKIEDVKALVDK